MRLWVVSLIALVLSPDSSAAQGPVTAQFWYSFGGKNREMTEAYIKRFNESQSKYRIEGTFQGDYFQALAKIRAAAATKTAPAVFHVIGEAIPQLAAAGLFENLEPYAKGANATNLDDFLPGQTQHTYFDYLGKPPAAARGHPVLPQHADPLLQRRHAGPKGVKVPTTWDELRDAAGKLTVRDGSETKVYGFEVPVDWWFWYAMLHQAGGTLVSPDGKQAAFREKGTEALQFWVDLVNKDKTMKRPPGKDYNAWEVTNTDFLNDRAAMIYTSTAFLNHMTESAKFKVGTAFLPGKIQQAVPTGGTFFVLARDAPAPQKEAGWAFIKWMTEPAQTISLSKATGYMPIRTSAVNSPEMQDFYKQHPNYKTAIDQLRTAQRFPYTPGLIEIQREVIQPNLETAVLGIKSAGGGHAGRRGQGERDPRK